MANNYDAPLLIWDPVNNTWVDPQVGVSEQASTGLYDEQDWAEFAAVQADPHFFVPMQDTANTADDSNGGEYPSEQDPRGDGEGVSQDRARWQSEHGPMISLHGLAGSDLDQIINILRLTKRPETAIHVDNNDLNGLLVILSLQYNTDPVEREEQRSRIAQSWNKKAATHDTAERDRRNQERQEADAADREKRMGGSRSAGQNYYPHY